MSSDGTIARTCSVLSSLMRGAVHDRHTIAEMFGVSVAAADRYIRTLASVPGVTVIKQGRRATVRFLFSEAIREAGI